MFIFKKINRKFFKLKILFKAVSIYWHSIFFNSHNEKDKKHIYFDISKPEIYIRYFYIFTKYFLIEGHDVFLKRSLRSIYYMCSNMETSLVFKESNFYIGSPSNISKAFRINDSMLNARYFDFLFDSRRISKAYYVPIGFHPYIYFKGYWNYKLDSKLRYNSLFMAGNFSKIYSNNYNEKFFGVKNRIHVKQFIEDFDFLEKVDSANFGQFISKLKDRAVYIVNREGGVPIHPMEIFEVLSRFEFFFALPGLYMPLCHNVVEAMAVGTIPFLQHGYSKLFQPELKNGVNCITFNGLEDLREKINFIFSLDQEKLAFLRDGVNRYYKDNLSAESIVGKVLSGDYSCIYLMAEEYSVVQMSEDLFSKE